MTISGADFEVVFLIALATSFISGIWAAWAVRDAYEQLGRGHLALDVPDRVEPAPLESATGQAEVQQLLDAIAVVRRGRADRDRDRHA
ncbi:MAG: hypothetical protein QOI98_540 [Solirubrobacteraceae bacterium]|nr:hypothetical protein [Solirubrobacteraceae bacterium]